MNIIDLVTDKNAIIFILLFSRISGFFAFLPFFSHTNISVSIKTALALYITILLFPVATYTQLPMTELSMFFAVVTELSFGFFAGFLLNIVFGALSFAGSQISMVMGFSMATVFDPLSGNNSPLISQILTLLAVMVFLFFDGHHLILLYLSDSLSEVTLGGFYPHDGLLKVMVSAVANLFKLGLIIAFPIIALSLLSDIIFGMLMKTMPQFNLLVVGFPIKIFLSTLVLVTILGSMMKLFREDFLRYFELLKALF